MPLFAIPRDLSTTLFAGRTLCVFESWLSCCGVLVQWANMVVCQTADHRLALSGPKGRGAKGESGTPRLSLSALRGDVAQRVSAAFL